MAHSTRMIKDHITSIYPAYFTLTVIEMPWSLFFMRNYLSLKVDALNLRDLDPKNQKFKRTRYRIFFILLRPFRPTEMKLANT
jgi:hypothetical protein